MFILLRYLIIHSGVFEGLHPSPIKIGRGSWVGAHALIAVGVSLRRGNLIGAKAIVTGYTPNHVFVAGIPAKVIRAKR